MIVTHCSVCHRHWKQAQQSTSGRSKSRKPKKSKDNRKAENKNSKSVTNDSDKTRTEEMDVFGGQHPWVMSSPQPRTVAGASELQEVDKAQDPVMPIPPEVKSSSPPEMNQESILTHLRGLEKAMGTLPEDLEAQLEKLEEQAKDRMLSHGHLNKLSELQRQLAALSTRIQEMDSNWKTFAAEVMKRFEEHQQMYKQTRTKLLQDFLKKNEELQAAKIEVQLASQTLFQQPIQPPQLPTDVDQQIQALEASLQEDGYSECQDIEMELMTEDQKKALKDNALKPFRSAGRVKPQSPSKVHAGHLQQNDKK